jgi:hypothetical protein
LAASSSFLSHMRYASMHSLRSKPRPWVHNKRGLEGGAGQGLQGVMMMLYTYRIGFVTNPWEGGGLATIKQCKEVKPQSLKPGMCCPRPLPAASPPPQPLIPPPPPPPVATLGLFRPTPTRSNPSASSLPRGLPVVGPNPIHSNPPPPPLSPLPRRSWPHLQALNGGGVRLCELHLDGTTHARQRTQQVLLALAWQEGGWVGG